jgi:predicted ATPase
MISLVEALGYRCLRYVRQPLRPFHVLVGPNASGKTTFLDTIAFLSQFASEGLDAAVQSRSSNFQELLWGHKGHFFELAVEARVPDEKRALLAVKEFDTYRYEVRIGRAPGTGEIVPDAERGCLLRSTPEQFQPKLKFPEPACPPNEIIKHANSLGHAHGIFSKSADGATSFFSEITTNQEEWIPTFRFGHRTSALISMPEDIERFPVTLWFKQLLANAVERIALSSERIRISSPPGQGAGFKPDGSNLPWVIAAMEARSPQRLRDWIAHVRMALPDLARVFTRQRDDDRHRYLVLVYDDGLEVPSWMASDGTLRLLALTLPAYLDDLKGIYLIEEPENGIHPRAVETMYQSLSSVYQSQILMASHSPVVLSSAKPADVLCFAKNSEGATDIVPGDKHPKLRDWHGEVNFGTLFASGVLG